MVSTYYTTDNGVQGHCLNQHSVLNHDTDHLLATSKSGFLSLTKLFKTTDLLVFV